MAELKTLTKKRSSIKSKTQIEVLADDADSAFTEREDFDRQFFNLVALTRSLLGVSSNVAGSEAGFKDADSGAHNSFRNGFVRLPKIDLPHFDGNYQSWLEFRDTFGSLIHDNKTISDINKFHYLRASLQGNAALIIKNLDFKASHYNIAWNLLCERYNNNRLLVNNHLQALFDVGSIIKESSESIRNLVDVINKNIRALTTLKRPTQYWDDIIIYFMSKKLDLMTSREWEEHRNNHLKDDPTLTEFCTFLGKKADWLESVESNCNLSGSSTIVALNNSNFNKTSTNNIIIKKSNNNNNKCPLCSQAHTLYKCESFRGLSIEDRIKRANEYNVCLNCLRFGHTPKKCPFSRCKYCKVKHNTLLHLENNEPKSFANPLPSALLSASPSSSNVVLSANTMQLATSSHILLSTAVVKVTAVTGKQYTARLLLDNGSTANFITEKLSEKLGLLRRGTSAKVTGINNLVSTSTQSCHLSIGSLCCAFTVDIDCHIIPEITKVLPSSFVHIKHVPIPSGLKLADPNFNVPSVVDILVGAEVFWNVLGSNRIDLGKNLPKLCETKLGWLVSGSISHQSSSISHASNNLCYHSHVTPDLTQFWELDTISSKHSHSLEERMCEQLFAQTTVRNDDGAFVVKMPLKGDPSSLGQSYVNARNRFLSLEKRFKRDPSFQTKYYNFMLEYERLGHMTLDADCTSSVESQSVTKYYIPHHGVIRNSSTTTQLRVVFDASAPTSTGVSLNDIQMVGPVVQDDLFSILTRFRQHRYVVTGDVEKMYRAIELSPDQRSLQKIIFRFDPLGPLRTYTLSTVTYGTASAPYLATKCLVSLADNIEDSRAQCAIRRDFYVDDFLSGSNTIQDTVEVTKIVKSVLSSAKFNLRKWRSNNLEILKQINSNKVNNDSYNILHFSEQHLNCSQSKTLGLNWVCDTDSLTYTINITSTSKVTKRHVLSVISQIFDPLGLVGPCVVEAKILMQRLWLDKYDWDDAVSLEISNAWSVFESTITSLNNLKIPRWVLREDSITHEVHVFTDASEKAYGACVYIRSSNSVGVTGVQLLVSRNRVAPIKSTTIPRLELCGALLGARLCTKVQESLTIPIHKCRFWCDSTIVLCWLSTPSNQLKPFVRNRVNEIQESTCGHTWNYVPSKDNPADLVSRGLRADIIKDTPLWWSGPSFLSLNENEWPTMPNTEKHDLPEVVTHFISSNSDHHSYHNRSDVNINSSIIHNLLERYSIFTKIHKIFTYVQRFIYNLKNKNKLHGNLSTLELERSLNLIIHHSQIEMFPEEYHILKSGQRLPRKSRLLPLSPFIDDHNLIRVGGRLDNSPYDFNVKHPILLCSKHILTKLIFQMQHLKLAHAGPHLLLSHIRQTYWPLGGRNLARFVVNRCLKCFRHRSQNVQPVMGQLPNIRTNLEFPFLNSYVDYAGPVLVANRKGRGCKLTKSYVCIFVCSAVKAVHLELVTDLTTEAYMAALNRFVARRGKPRSITSDNGTNFVGASNEMYRFLQSSNVASEMAQEGIEFIFTPAYSPHFNSLAEAAVKSCKHHLKRLLHLTHFTFEEMVTCLTHIEAVLNSRPLTPLSSDPNDFSALTPFHFLIGRPFLTVPHPQVTAANITTLDRWKRIQYIRQHFWGRFHNEYTSLLQAKSKWFRSRGEVKEGTLVLIKDKAAPPLLWSLGRVTKTYPGVDGITRVAELKTKRGTIRRAFNCICPLPVDH
ncbi:uncharacterized protein LOC113506069 isoform X1 [Trichoplusia ni]|uniref:Uncharacterized protein LOC113506069 isoform X1 n=1 Tax=Trichoplusia ni TaxID=7111 RepID=A0A7E5WV60_TRINI|nr:uncharacterized protein LOC113506069 isoform X1 [Trichoplusia ni]